MTGNSKTNLPHHSSCPLNRKLQGEFPEFFATLNSTRTDSLMSKSSRVKAFIAQLVVKAFNVPVLPRTPRLDVERLDLLGLQPLLDAGGDELGPVVALRLFHCFECLCTNGPASEALQKGEGGQHSSNPTLPYFISPFVKRAQFGPLTSRRVAELHR
jgi:hypothetical protein